MTIVGSGGISGRAVGTGVEGTVVDVRGSGAIDGLAAVPAGLAGAAGSESALRGSVGAVLGAPVSARAPLSTSAAGGASDGVAEIAGAGIGRVVARAGSASGRRNVDRTSGWKTVRAAAARPSAAPTASSLS